MENNQEMEKRNKVENKWWKDAINCLIFDLDGTLIDTEVLYNRFWVEAAHHFGYPMEPKHALMLRSLTPALAEPLMQREVCPDFDLYKVRDYRRKIMKIYIDEHGVTPKPYMKESLEMLAEKGYRIALATATPEERAREYLSRLEILPLFHAIATADMVKHGKPAPDIYLHAMEKLGCSPLNAAAIEDSPTGVQSGKASGAFTIMIPDMDEPDEKTCASCDLILSNLLELAELTPALR